MAWMSESRLWVFLHVPMGMGPTATDGCGKMVPNKEHMGDPREMEKMKRLRMMTAMHSSQNL